METIVVEVCSKCHPFFTGKQKFLDTARRVEKFQAKIKAKSKTAPKSKRAKRAAKTKAKAAKKTEKKNHIQQKIGDAGSYLRRLEKMRDRTKTSQKSL